MNKKKALQTSVLMILLCSALSPAALYRCNKTQGLLWDKSGSWDIWSGSAWVASSAVPTASDTAITASAAAGTFWTDNVNNSPLYIRSYKQQGYAADSPAYWANCNDYWLANRPNVARGLQIDGTLNAATVHLGYVSGTDPTYTGNDTLALTYTVYVHVAGDAYADANIASIVNHNTVAASIFRWTQYGGTVDVGNITLNASLLEYQLMGGMFTVTGSISGGIGMRVNIAGGKLAMTTSVFNSLVATGTMIQADGTAVNSGNVSSLLKVDTATSPGYSIASLYTPEPAFNPAPALGTTGTAIDTDMSWNAGAFAASHNVYFGTTNPPPFIRNQTSTSYDPGILNANTIYYWRIDEVNSYGTTIGMLWSFRTASSGNLYRCTDGLGLVWDLTGNWEIWNGIKWVKSTVVPTLSDDVLIAAAAAGRYWTYDFNHGNDPTLIRSYNQQGYPAYDPACRAYCNTLRVTNRPNVPRGLQIDGALTTNAVLLGYQSGADPTRIGNDTGVYTATVYIHYGFSKNGWKAPNADVEIGAVVNENAVAGTKFRWFQYGGTVDIGTIALNVSLFEYQLTGGTLTVAGPVTGTNMLLNIAGGTLVMNSSVWTSLVANGTMLQANGTAVNSGNVNTLLTVDTARYPGSVAVALPTTTAWNPSVADGDTNLDPDTDLSWCRGQYALSHDVYFGTSQSQVAAAQRLLGDINGDGPVNLSDFAVLAGQWLDMPGTVNPSADIVFSGQVDFNDFIALVEDWHQTPDPAFKGNQTSTVYDPGTLAVNTTYYWRVDEVNGASGSSPWTGAVRSFTTTLTTPPDAAAKPAPANGSLGVTNTVTLHWAAGQRAVSHNVYLGTSPSLGTGNFKGNQTNTYFAPSSLAYNTTYYWRIDEVNAYGTTTGTVWSFTTTPQRLTPEQFVILPWDAPNREWGPGYDLATVQTYIECGFTLAGFARPEDLDDIAAAGMKAFVFDEDYYAYEGNLSLSRSEIDARVASIVSRVGGHPATFGYYLRDEPPAAEFPSIAPWADSFNNADPQKYLSLNLGWDYNYASFLSYMPMVKYIAYDHYGVLENGTFTTLFFPCMEKAYSFSKSSGKPFWTHGASIDMYSDNPSWNTAPPSPTSLRFELYTSLAYGARGIGWFTYLSQGLPSAAIDMYGDKTAIWYYLQEVNLQLHRIGQTYVTLTNLQTFHYPTVPSGVSGMNYPSRGVSSSVYFQNTTNAITGGSYVVGEFTGPSNTKNIMVVNKSLSSNAVITNNTSNLKFKTMPSSIQYINASTGQWQTLSYNQTLSLLPGAGVLMKLN